MKKLLVLLFVAVLCVPCYGPPINRNILVYKSTNAFDPWIDFNDKTRVLATNVGTKQQTGYFVFDADVNTDANTWELNALPRAIFYGGTGSNKWGVSFDLNDVAGYVNNPDTENPPPLLFSIQGKTDKGLLFAIGWDDAQEMVGASWSILYGKIVKQDIGKGAAHKQGVPSSMKGIGDE
ncbi:MAG: hypothetical protein WAK60_02490, partial [Sedimentisphaerales bacterium]